MEFEKVINGIMRYLNAEVFTHLSSVQEFLSRLAVSRMLGNTETLKHTLMNNAFVKTFAIMDTNGLVDVDGLVKDIKRQIEQKGGKLTLDMGALGSFTFTTQDVDELRRHIG